MKKLFTLIALLAMVMGVNAKTFVDAEVDFSKFEDGSDIKFYNWGASESAKARLSIKNCCLHFESTEATDPSWDCQFHPIGGVEVDEGVTYTLHYKVKGSVAQNISALGFGLTPYGQFPITTEWVEGTFEYTAAKSEGGDLLFQCGDYVGEWDIAYLKITHEGKEEKPVEWINQLTNGDAETPWTADQKAIKFNDQAKNFTICAWGKQKGTNVNLHEDGNEGSDPFPAEIVEDPDKPGNHVFIVRGALADTEGDAAAWDNQFWIQSPKSWKQGTKIRVKFRYKASQACKTNTQVHKQNPSDYLFYTAVGDVNFTTEWQDFENTFTVNENQAGCWSIAFNLNPEVQNAVDFYFDDLSWEIMKLDEGYFVASANPDAGVSFDYDAATKFVYDDDENAYVATVGTENEPVSQIMVSTIYGNTAAFKGATLRPKDITGKYVLYEPAGSAVIDLPGWGVWKIYIDEEYTKMKIEMISGKKKEKITVTPNPTHVVVKGAAREEGTGNPWDNQFFIVANRTLHKGEVTILQFKYKCNLDEAKTTTQTHGAPGSYLGGALSEDVIFTSEEQNTGEIELVIGYDDAQSIAFNMSEILDACDYEIYDVIWKLKDDTESLIDMEGSKNFILVEGAGPQHEFGKDPEASGIENVVNKVNASNATFNIAGQRVANDFKGLVIKNGSKYLVK